MKRLALFCGAMLLFAGIASAQDSSRAEVFGGYSYVHESDNGQTANFNGGSGSLAYNLTPWLGVVGDFGGHFIPLISHRHAMQLQAEIAQTMQFEDRQIGAGGGVKANAVARFIHRGGERCRIGAGADEAAAVDVEMIA